MHSCIEAATGTVGSAASSHLSGSPWDRKTYKRPSYAPFHYMLLPYRTRQAIQLTNGAESAELPSWKDPYTRSSSICSREPPSVVSTLVGSDTEAAWMTHRCLWHAIDGRAPKLQVGRFASAIGSGPLTRSVSSVTLNRVERLRY